MARETFKIKEEPIEDGSNDQDTDETIKTFSDPSDASYDIYDELSN